MNFPPVLFHPINTITAYKGQMVYDTPQTQAKPKHRYRSCNGNRYPE